MVVVSLLLLLIFESFVVSQIEGTDWINYNTVQVGGRVLFVVWFAVVAVVDDNFV